MIYVALGSLGVLAAVTLLFMVDTVRFILFLRQPIAVNLSIHDQLIAKIIPFPTFKTFKNTHIFMFVVLLVYGSIDFALAQKLGPIPEVFVFSLVVNFFALSAGHYVRLRGDRLRRQMIERDPSIFSESNLSRATLKVGRGFYYWSFSSRRARLENGKTVWTQYGDDNSRDLTGYVFNYPRMGRFITFKGFVSEDDLKEIISNKKIA